MNVPSSMIHDNSAAGSVDLLHKLTPQAGVWGVGSGVWRQLLTEAVHHNEVLHAKVDLLSGFL